VDPIRYLLLGFTMVAWCVGADSLYSSDQNVDGFGEADAVIFSAALTVVEPWVLDAVSLGTF